MSWYVERLLRDYDIIKNTPEDISYDDLLSVEITISKLNINNINRLILELLKLNKDTVFIAKQIKRSNSKTRCLINKLTDSISNILGGRFTDDGYAEYIANKHGYDEYKLLSLRTFLRGRTYDRKT